MHLYFYYEHAFVNDCIFFVSGTTRTTRTRIVEPFKISSSVVAAIYLLDLLSKIDTYIVILYKLYFFSLLGTIFVNLYLTVTYSVIIQIQGPFVSLFKIMDLL